MAVVAFISQKGGVGKSTLARAVALEAASRGWSVKLADLDAGQATCVEWHRTRTQQRFEPTFSVELLRNVARAIAAGHGHDLLVVDGPARTDAATTDVARQSDLVVQPTGPSRDDLVPAVRVFHRLSDAGIEPKRLVLALNRIGTESEAQAARAFLDEAGYRALPGYLPERPAFRRAQNSGRAVTETRLGTLQGRADALIKALIDEIVARRG